MDTLILHPERGFVISSWHHFLYKKDVIDIYMVCIMLSYY